ncbi:MAG: hypothetical protein HQ495_10460 [Alphaproteobacteria bacterium]|nr:hypothetical protein [Alphaproteobacteria bacterium]
MEDTPKRSTARDAPHIVLCVVTEDLASVAPRGALIVTNCADQVLIHDACYVVRDRGSAKVRRYCQRTNLLLADDARQSPLARPFDIVGRVVSVIRDL